MRAIWIVAVLVAGCSSGPDMSTAPSTAPSTGIALERVADGFSSPLLALPDQDGRLVVVEQTGRAVYTDGTVLLDATDLIGSSTGERGLLGLAFHPIDPVLFAAYTDADGATALARFAMVDGQARDPAVLLTVAQPFANHNGGHIAFGPDGMLYMGLGDGGGAGDPAANGQNPGTLLGTLLRLEVGRHGTYEIPPDNPFVGDPLGRDEVWAYGLRNPWRFSFDAGTGDLWIADVGQNAYEEVNHQPAASGGGENYGWNVYEGRHQFPSGAQGPAAGTVFPVAEYHHDAFGGGHCSVTGGHVVHDARVPAVDGKYVFGDYCSGTIWSLDGPASSPKILLETQLRISSFGLDADGALLVVDHQGSVHRLVAA